MRNFMTLFALTVTFLTASASSPVAPPSCGANCPWLRPATPVAAPVAPPSCGANCPWLR